VAGYQAGATPNPCIDCNRYLKFEELERIALQTNYDYLVTGHYARIDYDTKTQRHLLKRGLDPSKDQSYVLYTLTQQQLAHTRFPLGQLTKLEVRKIAQDLGLPTAQKHESQDICFVPDGNYAKFIQLYLEQTQASNTAGTTPGDILDETGKILGQHRGLINYTIGQRKGLGIAAGQPLYVKAIDTNTNSVILAEKDQLQQIEALITNINLISVEQLTKPTAVMVKHRYRCTEQAATAVQISDDSIKVVFQRPLSNLTKGQALVMYDGQTVLGGGIISQTKEI
jgi:tRNA-specific 2-thiouridylase